MTLNAQVGAKFDPRRFTQMSGKMAALIHYVVKDVPFLPEPQIVGLVVTSDGYVLARTDEDPLADTLIGEIDELVDNFDRLIATVELTVDEEVAVRGWLEALVRYPDRQPVEALRRRRQAAAARWQKLYRSSPEAQVERARRIAAGLCVLDDGQCLTHGVPDTMAHHFDANPGASND